jgi:Zn-finger nucleic acid-binding protein
MQRKEKLICPNCGVEMNLHAEKIDRAGAGESAASESPGEDSVIEFHTCPRCALTLERAGV